MSAFTPREIVSELDRYIVGQNAAKRAVAIALRNRWRRQQVPGRAARRDRAQEHHHDRARPASARPRSRGGSRSSPRAPFVKVEASKFTEVGYVGRDVESIVRDLVEVGVKLVREEEIAKVRAVRGAIAEERLLDALYPRAPGAGTRARLGCDARAHAREAARGRARGARGRDRGARARGAVARDLLAAGRRGRWAAR